MIIVTSRVCRPETYRVKSIVYYTLRDSTRKLDSLLAQIPKRARESGSSTSTSRHPTPTKSKMPVSSSKNDLPLPATLSSQGAKLVQQIRTLLGLFDRILAEEYSEEHARMPHVVLAESTSAESNKTGDDIHCDFCGADVFQSFFECQRCPSSDFSSDNINVGDGHAICAGCYAEGRTCKCRVMAPTQCRPFDILLEDRRKTIQVLQSHYELDAKRPERWAVPEQ